MTRVENVNFSVWNVLAVAFRFAGIERQVVFAPEDKKPGLSRIQVCHMGQASTLVRQSYPARPPVQANSSALS